jgi:predicted NUDIX family NTP pyrophosphohydrolase
MQEFPEIDRAEWISIEVGRTKVLKGQVSFLDELASKMGDQSPYR